MQGNFFPSVWFFNTKLWELMSYLFGLALNFNGTTNIKHGVYTYIPSHMIWSFTLFFALLFCAQKPICLYASAFQFLDFESYFSIVILCLGAPAGTTCTVTTTDPNQQGNCQAADFCVSQEGNLYPSGDCWQASYNGGGSGGSQGPPAWGCCIGNIFHSMLI